MRLHAQAGNAAMAGLLAPRAARPQVRAGLTAEEQVLDLEVEDLRDDARLQSAFDNSPPMRQGETGEAVQKLQRGLGRAGFSMPKSTDPATGEVDGVFGSETSNVVKGFQHMQGIGEDAVVGRQTLRELEGRLRGVRPQGTIPSGTGDPAVAPAVTAAEESPAVFEACTGGGFGRFGLNIHWQTNGRNGYIVQEMTTTQTATFCDGTADDVAPAAPHFWEAWRVQEDGSVHPAPGADLWQMPVDPQHRGRWSLTGRVHFVEQLDPAAGFRVGNEAAGAAGSLYATTNQPQNLGPVLLTRRAAGRWACCDGESVHVPDNETGDPTVASEVLPATSSLLPVDGDSPGGGIEPISDEVCPPGYTMCDFIDQGISVAGQYALHELYSQGGSRCHDAIQMLSAVRSGQVQGIFKADEGKPAMLAQRNGTGWWALQDHPSSVPAGGDAFVFEGESPPMVVFKKSVADDRQALASALDEAWNASSIGGTTIPASPPTGKSCAPAPKPPEFQQCPEGEKLDAAGNCVKDDCPEGEVRDENGDCKPHKDDCPPGTVPDPSGELCVLPGKVVRPCTDADFAGAFQSAQDQCASIRMAIDLLCQLGSSGCDAALNPLVKSLCKLLEGDKLKPDECSKPREKFYEDCTVNGVTGMKDSMTCAPGSRQSILEAYRRWGGRITS